jgi:endonuclease G
MLSATAKDQFVELVQETRDERDNVKKLVAEGRRQQAEPDSNRLRRFNERKVRKILPAGAESLQGPSIDLQGAIFLPEGAQIRRAVAYVEVNTPQTAEVGTGFMVSPQLFLTCQHVIRDVNAARGSQITFDREMDERGRPCATTTFLLDPDKFALFSDEHDLDYALVAVGSSNAGVGILGDFGCCALTDSPDKHVIGMNVNIIQHPRGWPKMISVRNNLLTARTGTTLLYETDTDEGSSGAPVLNDEWDLIALHHWGQPFLEKNDENGNPIPTTVNEGVRISAICRNLMSRLPSLPLPQQELLKEVFAKPAASGGGGPTLSPPHPNPSDSEGKIVATKGKDMGRPSSNNEFTITLPLEITVRIGGPVSGGVEVASPALEAPAKVLTRGAEALHIDANYQNRSGYVDDFIQNHVLPLPQPTGNLANQIAPLRPTEPNAAGGLLKYEHFSIKINKSKRMAMFTATNIDGETYLNVDRDTGLVSGSEGETWYKDPRISESFCLNQPFFSAWSIYFDRGHLTRRTDPTWGTDELAERANADTYHFTNCSPQHFRFNQTTQYWQGAERYILENGLFAADSRKHLCVFQGPIFNSQVDRFADDIQIPSSFFKIVVWRGDNGLKAVGLIVDQLSLLDEKRVSLGPPHDVPFVDVSQWRVAIPQIETRTKLDFGEAVRNADTINAGDQPLVGGEAARPIRAFRDLLA